jgi:hypothetical protein
MPLQTLQTPALEARESLVKMCEELLDLARKGEIVEVVASAFYANGTTQTFAHDSIARSRRIGMAAQLMFDLCASPGK